MKPWFSLLAVLATQVAAWSEEWQAVYGDFELSSGRHRTISTHGQTLVGPSDNYTGEGYFKQLIDHNDPSKGTFDQLYLWSNEFWRGPGSPVIMFTPGEVNASRYGIYMTLDRITGVMARELGAAIFVMEHRYWGNSTPYAELTTANLQYLTLENSIYDLTYFANNIKAPWEPTAATTAKEVPWIMSGGSYSGALAAWTESVSPGVYWAYHASSAPVEAISDLAAYFYPVQEGMPKNCSRDIDRVINYMDDVIASGNESEIARLKTMFRMEDVVHNDDFMGALENGPWLWQENQLYTGYSPFFHFCDMIENANTTKPTEDGVGLEKALQGYADWFTNVYLPNHCYDSFKYADFNGTYNTKCFDTYNASSPLFTDTSLSNTNGRSWNWMLCNEPFGYWQDGAPKGRPTLVSRLINANYWIRQCDLFFPPGPNGETYGIGKGRTEADTNKYTKGWSERNTTRLIYVNSQYDPWRDSGVSAQIRPGGPLQSTPQTPVMVVPGGFHTTDMITKNSIVNPGCKAVVDLVVQQIVVWVGQWTKPKSVNVR